MRTISLLFAGALTMGLAIIAAPAPRAGATGEPPTCNGKLVTIFADKSGAPIYGTARADVILGTGGDDRIFGRGGDDTICAGFGNDYVEGGADNDWIDGYAGADQEEPGGPICRDENGFRCEDDVLKGNADNDYIQDAEGWNRAEGGSGADVIYATGHILGGTGNDELYALLEEIECQQEPCVANHESEFASLVEGNSGNDQIWGTELNDDLRGNAGVDWIDGLGEADLENGGSGKDTCVGIDGFDIFISCETLVLEEP